MNSQQEYVLRQVSERGIDFIRLWFTDVLGLLKSVTITATELESAFDEGIGFDGSSIEGYARVREADMLALPDASTFQIVPWKTHESVAARMFCDIATPERQPAAEDPRHALRRNLAAAADMGFTFVVHPEVEFFLFPSETDPTPLDRGGYFDMTPLDVHQGFRRHAIEMLEDMSIPVEFSHHEVAPSQHEIDLRHADAMTMADSIMTLRAVVKEAALARGLYATFMPKPLEEHWGSAMHLHMSLWEGDKNVFYDPAGERRLSTTARAFIAGVLAHAREITPVTNQWINSYKRLVPGFEAPVDITWGASDKSSLIRIPMHKPSKGQSTRIELRSPDPGTNPYLAFSVILAAGLRGIREGMTLGDESHELGRLSRDERRALGITSLPRSLGEALVEMERSELVAEALGEHIFRAFLANKWAEWETYRTHVTRFEIERYLPML